MGWEDAPGRTKSQGINPRMPEDQVAIVTSKNRDKITYRINVNFASFPEGVKQVKIRMDVEKNRLGLFAVPEGEMMTGKAINAYDKKNRKSGYISLSTETIEKLKLAKGRYKICKMKEPVPGMYFFIKTDSPLSIIPEETPPEAAKAE